MRLFFKLYVEKGIRFRNYSVAPLLALDHNGHTLNMDCEKLRVL